MLRIWNAQAAMVWMTAAVCLLPGSARADSLATDLQSFKVTGDVRLMRRNTRVIQPVCDPASSDHAPCPKSEPYWVLTVEQNGVLYETRHRYHVGEEQSPESVEILIGRREVSVRPGSHVTLAGQGRQLSSHSVLLEDPVQVDFAMDLQGQTLAWVCHSPADLRRPLRVEVFKGIGKALDNYSVDLFAESNQGESTIIDSDQTIVDRSADQLTFSATSDSTMFELSLDQRSRRMDSVLGRLQVWGERNGAPIDILSEVRCDRRLSD